MGIGLTERLEDMVADFVSILGDFYLIFGNGGFLSLKLCSQSYALHNAEAVIRFEFFQHCCDIACKFLASFCKPYSIPLIRGQLAPVRIKVSSLQAIA